EQREADRGDEDADRERDHPCAPVQELAPREPDHRRWPLLGGPVRTDLPAPGEGAITIAPGSETARRASAARQGLIEAVRAVVAARCAECRTSGRRAVEP